MTALTHGAPLSGTTDQNVTISFRKLATCLSSVTPAQIEVESVSVADGGNYSEDLAQGSYSLVASTENADTQKHDNISTGSTLNINFP